jgi:hypothetical protein
VVNNFSYVFVQVAKILFRLRICKHLLQILMLSDRLAR